MSTWSTCDYPSLSNSTRSTRGGSTRFSPGSTRSHGPFGGSPSNYRGRGRGGPHSRGGRGGGAGGGGGGSHGWWGRGNGSGSHGDDINCNELCEKFDELEVIEDSNEVTNKFNNNNNYVNVNVNQNANANDNFNDDDDNNNKGINFDAYEDIPVEVSGQNVPKKVSSFGEINLGKALNENIKRCNYVKPTPIQCHAIPIAMEGRDLMACAQTGSGKTAAFCFPIIAGILRKVPPYRPPLAGGGVRGGGGGGIGGRMVCPVALIMSPTRELASQIHDEAQKFAYQTGVKVAVAYGGTPMVEQLRKLAKGVDILVATPGRLVDMIERGKVSLRMVRYLTLDEADRMLDMGFEPQIRKIVQQMDMPPPGSRQTMLFSATFPTEIQRLASDFLSNYIFLAVGKVGSSTDLIEQKVEFVDDFDKKRVLKDILLSHKINGANGKHPLTIVFAETKRGVDDLSQWLSNSGIPATAIHGDKVQWERERALRSFKSGTTPIIVATDVAARGLDIPCVAHVINFDLPRDIDDYVHRIGRTGRAGKSGLATAFFNDKNQPISKALIELMEDSHQEVPSWLVEYADTPSSYGYGGSSSGSRKSRGGNFGGRDYRNFNRGSGGGYSNYSDYNTSTNDYSNTYSNDYSNSCSNDYSNTCTNDYSKADTDEFVGASDPYDSPAYGFTHGYDSIVATGWD